MFPPDLAAKFKDSVRYCIQNATHNCERAKQPDTGREAVGKGDIHQPGKAREQARATDKNQRVSDDDQHSENTYVI